MIKKATVGMFMLLLVGLMGLNQLIAKAQTANPSEAVITVSGVPSGTKGLAVEVTVDTSIVKLGSASSSLSGALVVTDGASKGIGVIASDISASFTITVPLEGVAAGTSAVTVGKVLDKLNGTEIAGASASVDVSSVTVGGASTSGGGAGGALDSDTLTITVDGVSDDAQALVLTVNFSDSTVAKLASTSPTFMGSGATSLFTETMDNVLTVTFSGDITDNRAVVTGMLEPGTMAGTTSISVSKVQIQGGTDVTDSVAVTVDPPSVTNSSPTTSLGTFTFVGPDEVTGPGKAAFGFEVDGAPSNVSATLNGSKVTFTGNAGVAIVSLPDSGSLDLTLEVMSGGSSESIDLGSVSVSAGDGGKAPKAKKAKASNKSTGSTLTVSGSSLTDADVEIVPTDKDADSVSAKSKKVKATYSECIPNGSFANVSTASGTGAAKIKVRGSCSDELIP